MTPAARLVRRSQDAKLSRVERVPRPGTMTGLVVDLFAGGGGASTGIEAALGRPVDVAINHSAVALAVHEANHPGTTHMTADIWSVRPRDATKGRPVDLLWASPDCTHFSRAKGGKPKKQKIRSLAWAVVRWANDVRPRLIFVENVPEFAEWGPLDEQGYPLADRRGESFGRWRRQLVRLGYQVEHRVLVASHYGAPTSRKRLFIVARCDGEAIRWPEPTHGPGLRPCRTAADCIDWSIPCPSIFERKRPLAEKTLWRIAQGIRRFVFESPRPFIVQANHGGRGRREVRAEQIDMPLSTVTGRRGHAVVAPTLVQTSYGERPGQRARYLDLHQPLGTVVAGGQKHALVEAFLLRYYGDPGRSDGGGGVVVGAELAGPIATITARDHHALTAAILVKMHGQCNGSALDEPMPTVTAGGLHVAEVRAFLTIYYGSDGTGGQGVLEPMRVLTARHRLGLVEVEGVWHQIADIGMRMLKPHELLRGQFGRFAASYDLSAAKTQEAQVRLIGNSVCPDVAEALVRANAPDAARRAA